MFWERRSSVSSDGWLCCCRCGTSSLLMAWSASAQLPTLPAHSNSPQGHGFCQLLTQESGCVHGLYFLKILLLT